jgi:hypothetical protein
MGRTGLVLSVGGIRRNVAARHAYVATASVVQLAGLPGERRRFTGSYETASFDPASMPNTIDLRLIGW